MTWVLSGSIIIPSLDTMKPSSFPCSTAKMDFLGFREMFIYDIVAEQLLGELDDRFCFSNKQLHHLGRLLWSD
jgi:hypothetical protein